MPSDGEVRQAMIDAGAFPAELYKPRPGCERCGLWQSAPMRCAMIRNLALVVQAQPAFAEAYRRYTRSLAEEPPQAVGGFREVRHTLRQTVQPADDAEEQDISLCALVHLSAEYTERQGAYYDIPYHTLAELHTKHLLGVLTPVARNFQNDRATLAQLAQFVEPKAQAYGQAIHLATNRRDGPFAGCIFCKRRCHFGLDLAPLARDPVLQRDVLGAIQNTPDTHQMWAELTTISRNAAALAIATNDPAHRTAAAVCFAAQVGPALGFNRDTQRNLTSHVRDGLMRTGGTQP